LKAANQPGPIEKSSTTALSLYIRESRFRTGLNALPPCLRNLSALLQYFFALQDGQGKTPGEQLLPVPWIVSLSNNFIELSIGRQPHFNKGNAQGRDFFLNRRKGKARLGGIQLDVFGRKGHFLLHQPLREQALHHRRCPVRSYKGWELCKKHLAPFKVPKKIIFVDALPKTPTGKILKRDMRKTYTDVFSG
jgi:hypothetical protein